MGYVLILNMSCKNPKPVLEPEDELNNNLFLLLCVWLLYSWLPLHSGLWGSCYKKSLVLVNSFGIASLCHFLYEAVPDSSACARCPFWSFQSSPTSTHPFYYTLCLLSCISEKFTLLSPWEGQILITNIYQMNKRKARKMR